MKTKCELKKIDLSAIDVNHLREIFGDDEAGIHQFIALFIDATDKLIKKIEIALNTRNLEEAEKMLHTLSGSSGNSGATDLYTLSRVAEQQLANEEWRAAEVSFQQMKNAFAVLCEEFKEWAPSS